MLRRWCIPLATIALLAGSGIAAASATAASASVATRTASIPRSVSPGGLVGHLVRPGSTARSAHGIRGQAESTNWSGYAAASGTYTSVSSSWTEPTGTCTSSNQYAAFWVGLDGYSSSTVEQDGTMIECVGRTAEYLAWYEMYPNNPVYFNVTLKPGDHISASVTYDGSSKYTLKLADSTQGWSESVNQSLSGASNSSAEVIVEAPCCTSSGGILPLADFHTAGFSGSTVDGSALSNSNPTQIIMIDNSGRDKDTVSSLSGGSFSATWVRSN